MNELTKFESAKANPSEIYSDPKLVIEDNSLNDEQKLEILTAWKSEAIHLQESETEGLTGGEKSRLDEIESVINTFLDKNCNSVLKDLNN